MYRRVTTLVVGLAFLVAGLSATGCSKKFSCKAFANKVKKCKKELTAEIVASEVAKAKKEAAKLPEDQRKQKVEQARKQAEGIVGMMVTMMTSDEFVKKCEEDRKKGKDKKGVKEAEECMKKSSCKEFAKCFVKHAGNK